MTPDDQVHEEIESLLARSTRLRTEAANLRAQSAELLVEAAELRSQANELRRASGIATYLPPGGGQAGTGE